MKLVTIAVALMLAVGCGGGTQSVQQPTPAPAPAAVFSLNFDDGYASALNIGLPIVQGDHLPSTWFIITEACCTNHAHWGPNWFDQTQLLQLYNTPDVEIAGHTRTHPHLTTLTPAAQQDEIQGSYNDLCAILKTCPASFAYPYGDQNSGVESITKQSGYANARIVSSGYNGTKTDKYLLNAMGLTNTTQWSDVQSFIDNAPAGTMAVILIHRVDETGSSISITHQLLQQICDYLVSQHKTVMTQSEALKSVGLN